MTLRFGMLVGTVLATTSFVQGEEGISGASPLVAIENEPAPKLIVDSPLPGPLARGAVLIPYRVENFRILPVLGADATKVSPRVGHLHVTVDDLPWPWETLVTAIRLSWLGCRLASTKC